VFKNTVITLILIFNCQILILNAQNKYYTRSGKIVFFSKAPIENIKAVNNQVSCIYEIESNRIVANVLISAFEFEKSLMQQHFNENYLESDKFPKATFKGKLLNIQDIDFKSNWVKNTEFEGDLTIHGVGRKMKSPVNLKLENGVLYVSSEFYIALTDFNIKVPNTVINNIAEKINVKVNLKMDELKN
jgi:hypothetical protein